MITGMCKNFRLFFSSRMMLVLLLLSMGLSILFSYELFRRADDQSKIVIGLIDEDQSALSEQFIDRARENESVSLIMEDEDTLYEMFRNREINSVFTIKKGFEQNIEAGNYQGMIRVEYPEDDGKFRIVSDMLGADLIEEICKHKTGNYYGTLDGNQKADYEAFFEQVKDGERFLYRFDMEMVSKEGESENLTTGVSIVYRQIVVAFLGILTSFLLMEAYFFVTTSRDSILYIRERCLPNGTLRYQGGAFLYYGVFLLAISGMIPLLLWLGSSSVGLHFTRKAYFMMFFWELLAGLCNYMIFYICRTFLKNELICQAVGMMYIFLTGAVSVVSLVIPQFQGIAKWIPLTHMMQQMIH